MTVRLWDLRGLKDDNSSILYTKTVASSLYKNIPNSVFSRLALKPLTRSLERMASAAWIQVYTNSMPSHRASTHLQCMCNKCTIHSSSTLSILWCLQHGTPLSSLNLKLLWWEKFRVFKILVSKNLGQILNQLNWYVAFVISHMLKQMHFSNYMIGCLFFFYPGTLS